MGNPPSKIALKCQRESSMSRRVCGIDEEAQVVQGPFQREGDSWEVSSLTHSTEY